MTRYFALQAGQVGQQRLIERRGATTDLAAKRDTHFDFATLNCGHDGRSQIGFQRAQIVIDAELQIEEA